MASTWLKKNLVHITWCSRVFLAGRQSALPSEKRLSRDLGTVGARPDPDPKPPGGSWSHWGECWGPSVSSEGLLRCPCCLLLLPLPRVLDSDLRVKDCRWSKLYFKCAKYKISGFLIQWVFSGHYFFPKSVLSWSETGMWGEPKQNQTVLWFFVSLGRFGRPRSGFAASAGFTRSRP